MPADLSLTFRVPRVEPNGPLLPNLLISGVSHAGAGALARRLAGHPQVCRSATRRIDHFTPLRFGRPVEEPLEEYDRHFAAWAGQRYRLETSPVYFDGGTELVGAVRATLPEVRVLIVLRDPVHRLWIGYHDKIARRRLPAEMSFETFVERCLALRNNGADRFEGNRYFRTLSGGFYVEHLPRWLEAFGRRVRILFAEHLMADPESQLTSVYDWLGLNPDDAGSVRLDPESEPELPTPASGVNRFLPVLQRSAAPSSRNQASWAQAPWSGVLRRMPRQADRVHARVRTFYAPANRALATVLDERGYGDLPDWLRAD